MNKTLIYLFDPLCGWCYGAMPTLSALNKVTDITIELLPTGLFSGEGARVMNKEFAAYAWSNDQRITALTGQRFTERYRENVLNDSLRFDSGPATLALTAVSLTESALEMDALKAIQIARYVDGQDTVQFQTLVEILQSLGLQRAADMLINLPAELVHTTQSRIHRAQTLMSEMNARGVPTFIASSGEKCWRLDSSNAYEDPSVLIKQLQ